MSPDIADLLQDNKRLREELRLSRRDFASAVDQCQTHMRTAQRMRDAITAYVNNCDADHLAECQFCRDYGRDACPREPREDFMALRDFT